MHQPDPNAATDHAALVQCVGAKSTAADKVASTDSPDFSLNDASISSNASSFTSQADLDDDTKVIDSPNITTCYEQLLKAQLTTTLPAGTTVTAVSVHITPGASGGPANVVGLGTGTITVAASGQQITIYLAVAFITGPLIEAEVDFENPTRPVPAATFVALVDTVAVRAAPG